jgi:hypothetical protein
MERGRNNKWWHEWKQGQKANEIRKNTNIEVNNDTEKEEGKKERKQIKIEMKRLKEREIGKKKGDR